MKISQLTLFTAQITKQLRFYTEVLELPLIDQSNIHFTLKIGDSHLKFVYKADTQIAHYAINIPNNKIVEAVNWLNERLTPINVEGNSIVDFSGWNAEAVYFQDPDGNILELIARKNLENQEVSPFSVYQFLKISEIGMPTNNIETIYQSLNSINKIPIFDGNFDRFCAAGDDNGLFIIINSSKKKWFPTMQDAFPADFVVKGDFNFSFVNGMIHEQVAFN